MYVLQLVSSLSWDLTYRVGEEKVNKNEEKSRSRWSEVAKKQNKSYFSDWNRLQENFQVYLGLVTVQLTNRTGNAWFRPIADTPPKTHHIDKANGTRFIFIVSTIHPLSFIHHKELVLLHTVLSHM